MPAEADIVAAAARERWALRRAAQLQAQQSAAWLAQQGYTTHDQLAAQRLPLDAQMQNGNARIAALAAALRNAHRTGGYVPKDEQPSGERTQEQIIADCEAAYAELLADIERKRTAEDAARIEAAKPKCAGCRWHKPTYPGATCHQPLVKGVGAAPEAYDGGYWGRQGKAKLCGPEKALWEPKLRWWEKIFDWAEEKCNYLLARLRDLF